MEKRPNVTLKYYELKIRKYFETDYCPDISNFGEGWNFFTFLKKYLEEMSDGTDSKRKPSKVFGSKKVMLRSSDHFFPTPSGFYGLILTGDYGIETPVINIESGKETYVISPEEAGVLPFYFFFFVPPRESSAILILQSYKNLGIYTSLSRDLAHNFGSQFNGYKLEIVPFTSKEIGANFLKRGTLKKISITDVFSSPEYNPLNKIDENIEREEYFVEIIFKPKKKGNGLFRRKDLNLSRELFLQKALYSPGFSPGPIKLQINYLGKDRTIDLANLETLASFIDISREVEINESTQIPVFNSIHELSYRYFKEAFDFDENEI